MRLQVHAFRVNPTQPYLTLPNPNPCRCMRLAVIAAETLKAASGGNLVFEGAAWNSSSVDTIRLARAHCQYSLLKNFSDSVARAAADGSLSPGSCGVLQQLAGLLALTVLEDNAGEFMTDGYVTGAQATAARVAHRRLLAALRPNAVALVDAFGLEDYALNSAIGRADGDVYRSLLEMAQASPLNDTEEGPAWEHVLKPVMTKPRAKL